MRTALHGVIASSIKFPAGGPVGTPIPILMHTQGYNEQTGQHDWTNQEVRTNYQYGLAVDSNGVMAVTGRHNYNSVDSLYVSAYDATGSILWQRLLSNSGNTGNAIVVNTAGDFIAFGEVTEADTRKRATAVKYTAAGTQVWQKAYSATDAAQDTSFFAAETDGTNFYAVGYRMMASGFRGGLVTKIDATGDLVWQRLLTIATEDVEASAVSVVSDGVVVTYRAHNLSRVGVVKYDTSGNEVWHKVVNGMWPYILDSVVDTAGNIYISHGDTNVERIHVKKLTSTGTLVWSKELFIGASNLSAWYFSFERGTLTTDGTDIWLTAAVSAYNSSSISVVRLDTDGTIVSQRAFNDGGDNAFPEPVSSVYANGLLYLTGSSFWTIGRQDFCTIAALPLTGNHIFDATTNVSEVYDPYFKVKIRDESEVLEEPAVIGISHVASDVVAGAGLMTESSVSAPSWMAATVSLPNPTPTGTNWIVTYGPDDDQNRNIMIRGQVTDNAGNTIIAGTDRPGGTNRAVVAKLDPSGAVVWEKQLSQPYDSYSLAVDASDNIYLAAYFPHSSVFKFDSSGNQLWQRQAANSTFNTYACTIDATSLYLVGRTSANPADVVIVKLALSDGTTVAQRKFGDGSFIDLAGSISLASDGSLLVGGYFIPGAGLAYDAMVLNVSADLTTINWRRTFRSTTVNRDYITGVVTDNSGIVYALGDCLIGGSNPDTGQTMFAKFAANGDHIATRTYQVQGSGVLLNSAGPYGSDQSAIRVGSHIYMIADYLNYNEHATDIVVLKFDLDGALVWSKKIRTPGENGEASYGISSDGSNLYICGYHEGDTYLGLLIKLPLSEITNGVFGRYIIGDLPMEEVAQTLTLGTTNYAAPAVTTYTFSNGSHTVTASTGNTIAKTPLP